MKITIESTPELVHANGLPVRLWTGETDRGTPIVALITRIAVPAGADASELEGELSEPPTRVVVQAEEVERLRDRLQTIVDEAFGLQAVCTFDELLDILGREQNAERIRLVNQRGELERDLAVARASLARAGGWLVKDFHALYLSARALHEALVRGLAVDDDDDVHALAATQAHQAIALQLARLSPAFEVCEAERRGAPDRLTPGEQIALMALHGWLHSPEGNCELIDAAAMYHDQVERESPAECERLEAEGRLETGEPCAWVEPDLCSACVEASDKPAEAFTLTDAARDYYKSDLRYRAPEHLSPRDRLIIAAVDAEEALAAKSPETWVGGERQ